MPRLSIVVPALGRMTPYEDGLASVLQHRPASCEVLVVHNEPYEDPYQLASEVRFVRAATGASAVECANLAFRQCRAPIVHLLAGGLEATEGWADVAQTHFRDRRVAAVAPLVFETADRRRVTCCGLDYRRQGAVVRRAGTIQREWQPGSPVLGPSTLAAFYRRSVLEALGGFDAAAGDGLADVDLALSLRHLGYRAVVEPRSQLIGRPAAENPRAFAAGRAAEQVFLRFLSLGGEKASLPGHAWLIARELVVGLVRPSKIAQVCGRLTALKRWSEAADHRRRLDAIRDHLIGAAPAAEDAGRIDRSHRSTRGLKRDERRIGAAIRTH